MANDGFPLIPPWEDMDFAANCTAWGNWLATWLLPNPWNRQENLSGGFSTTLMLINQSFPAGAIMDLAGTGEEARRLSGKLAEWWTYVMLGGFEYDNVGQPIMWNTDSDFVKHVLRRGVEKCPKEMCRAQAYLGNSDITGIGIYISYFVQAALTTLFLLAFTLSYARHRPITRGYDAARHTLLGKRGEGELRGSTGVVTLGRRTMDAFRGSLEGFFVSAILMCVAMISAALYLAVQAFKQNAKPIASRALPFGNSSTYNMVLSVIAATFSTFPVLVLYTLLSWRDGVSMNGDGRISFRQWLRRAALFAIWVLLVVEVYLSPRGNVDYERRHDEEQEANWDPCNKRGGTRYWQTMKAAQWLVIGLPLLWLVISTFLTGGFGIPWLKDKRWIQDFAEKDWVRSVREFWELGVAWFNLLILWALLAYASILREEILDTTGAADTANQWGFGQILTLATWAPVVVEWLYVFVWGLEDSINTRLPRGLELKTVETWQRGSGSVCSHEHDDIELPRAKSVGSRDETPSREEAEPIPLQEESSASTERTGLPEETTGSTRRMSSEEETPR